MGLLNAEGKVTGDFLNIVGATSGVFQAGAAINTILTAVVLDKVSIWPNVRFQDEGVRINHRPGGP